MIFSDNYTVKEKYSLLQKKHLGTFSEIPWICTPLCDERYLPTLSDNIKNKLNCLFNYKYFFGQDTIKDEKKYLGLHHIDDKITSYQAKIDLGYYNIQDSFGWNHFIASSNILEMLNLKDVIEKLTSETDIHYTSIVSVEYDENCEENVLYIFDTTYNLDEYTQNSKINDINSFCKKNYQLVEGSFGIYTNSTKVKYFLDFKYPFMISIGDYKDPKFFKDNEIRVPPFVASERFLTSLFDNKLLSQDNVDYIFNDILKDLKDQNYKFDLEYIFDESGEIEDIIFYRCIYEEFDEVETVETML